MAHAQINSAGKPMLITRETLEADALLTDAAMVVARNLSQGIAGLDYPVGMGIPPHPVECLAAATKIVERFRGATLAALHAERFCKEAAMLDWEPIDTAPRDGTLVDLWANGRRWTDFAYQSDGVRGWCREEGHPVTYRHLLTPPTHWRRITGPKDPRPTIDAAAPASAT